MTYRGEITSESVKLELSPDLYTVDRNDIPDWMLPNMYGVLVVLSTSANNVYALRPFIFISSNNSLYYQWVAYNQPDMGWRLVTSTSINI